MAERQLASRLREVLGRLSQGADLRETLDEILRIMADASGCESLGIRWRAGDDCPYYVTRGFGRKFLVVEGRLCIRGPAGVIERHPDGTAKLACMCGAVVEGRTDATLPYITDGGSFWTNGTTALLRDSPPIEAGLVTRNYCNVMGYESVALIPLRVGRETYGLLQLNSYAPGRFREKRIVQYEGLAREIAEAIAPHKGKAEELS